MKKIKQSNEDEMIYEFLKMELCSDLYGENIKDILQEMGIDKRIIENGNIESMQENTLRIKILERFRGYRDKKLFERFPLKIEWVWTVFDNDDLSKIRYIEYDYWNELSNYTGSPLEAAKTILSGKTVFDVPNDRAIKGAQKLKNGYKFPPLIFLTDEIESRYIILEGHGRMTAYGLVPDLFHNVSALLGYCSIEDLNNWYGEMPKRAE